MSVKVRFYGDAAENFQKLDTEVTAVNFYLQIVKK